VALAKPCSGSVHSRSSEISEVQLLPQGFALPDASSCSNGPSIDHPSWFAIFTRSHHEKAVRQHLIQQQIEAFLPLYSQVRQWTNRRRVTLQLPLFPNYVFVRLDRRDRARVLAVQGVLSIVGRGSDPTPLSEFEIESLRSGLHLRNFEPHPLLVVGMRVRIKIGALEGMEGVLLRNKNNLRVVLTVALINQSVAVEVDVDDVEPVTSRHSIASFGTRAMS
jgi:transcription antitermination factor NusG